MPLTGAGFNAVGRQLQAALKLYMEQHGDTVAGRQIQITIRDDGGVADNARRLIQERIVNQKVDILGIGITPTALAIAQLATESKKATLVLSSGASITTTKSPYYVRAGFILPPQSWILAEWAAKNGSKRVVTLVNDWAPGVEAETSFTTRFKQVGGEIVETMRIPLANPDFAPFLQRIGDIRRRRLDRRHEGHGFRKPARADLDRSGHPRHRQRHLHPQSGEEGRPALE